MFLVENDETCHYIVVGLSCKILLLQMTSWMVANLTSGVASLITVCLKLLH